MERAVRLLLTWGFEERGLETVIWWSHQGNWPSRRLAWRLGFAVEGRARRWLTQRGELRDAWVGTLVAGDPMHPRTPWYDVPRIVGDRVVLRRIRPDDADRIVEGCLDPETARWLGQIPQPYTREMAEEFIASREPEHADGYAVNWALADPATDSLTGLVNLFAIQPGRDAEVGYWVHPGGRRRGLATEGCRLALRHAFVPMEDGGLGLQRVHALAAVGNLASQRVLERAGLSRQGHERRRLTLGSGELTDAVAYDVLAEEHLGRPALRTPRAPR
jgi:RimJ/RimL family protein N-acetyltransferase